MVKNLYSVALLFGCIAIASLSSAQTSASKTTKTSHSKTVYTKDPATGVEYHFFKHDKKGKMPAMGDFVNVKLVGRNEKDSVLFSSLKKGDSLGTFKMQLTKLFNGCLEQGIALMAVGDSAEFKISADSMFYKMMTRNPSAKMPPFLPAGSFITFDIKLVKFQTKDELKAEQQKAIDVNKIKERTSIAKYLADSNIHVTPTADSLFVIKQISTSNPLIKPGDSVFVTYVGKLLNGKVFDQSADHPGAPFVMVSGKPTLAMVYNQTMPLIHGWVEALGMMHNGDKITILVPSSIAYGPRQMGPIIAPYSPLIFDMEVLKVVPAAGKR
ncbi:MAG: FKBP-type peptidyl-prolyl cis-trans isomerase [Bacteroidia bacterium]